MKKIVDLGFVKIMWWTRYQIQVVADMNVIPSNYKESIFAPLQKKEIDLMDVEQSMIHSVFQDGTTVVHAGLIFFILTWVHILLTKRPFTYDVRFLGTK